jgi:oligopeptide transport system permease protein
MRALRIVGGSLLTVWVVLTVVFFMVRLAPGGPFDSEKALSPDIKAQLEHFYGLDKPITSQYLDFLGHIARGDLGISLVMEGESVGKIIAQAFPVSLGLGGLALLIAAGAGIPLGFYWAGQKKRGIAHKIISGRWLYLFAMLPSFVAAPLLQQLVLLCGGRAYGYEGFSSLLWPSLTLGLYYLPFVARLVQVGFQEESRGLYLRVAQSKGLSRKRALWQHGAKAALSPVLAYLGPTAAGLITGSFVVETVWGLPGMGRFFVNSVFNRDDTLLLGLVAFYALILIFFNTVIELVLSKWNPASGRRLR